MILVEDYVVKIEHFLSGEQRINIDFLKNNKYNQVDIKWFYENEEELLSIIYITKHIKSKGINLRNLYMPYIPNARMDRVEDDNDIFTLKYFSEIINNLGFDKVVVEDAHSNVSLALIDNIYYDNYVVDKRIKDILTMIQKESEYPVYLFYPDSGAMKRYTKFIKYPYFLFGEKDRDWSTGKIKGLNVLGEIPNKNFDILIVDDICSKGGTFYYSAKKLKDIGANNIYLYVTHCENSIFKGEFDDASVNLLDTKLINHVYTTNSIYKGSDKRITVLK